MLLTFALLKYFCKHMLPERQQENLLARMAFVFFRFQDDREMENLPHQYSLWGVWCTEDKM